MYEYICFIKAKLSGREKFIKSPGSSFAFIGYKGYSVLPWRQVNQRMAGDGASAIYAIIGILIYLFI